MEVTGRLCGLLIYALNLMFIGPIVLCVFSVLTEIDIPKRYFPSLKDGGMILNSLRMIHNVMSWYEIWRVSAGILIGCFFKIF